MASWAPGVFSGGGSRDTRRPAASRASGQTGIGRATRSIALVPARPTSSEAGFVDDRLDGHLTGATSGGRAPSRRSSASTSERECPFPGVRVLIADDHLLFAEALRSLLSVESWIEVVGHAGNGREAVELAEQLDPDLILIDLDMPVMSGVEAIRQIRRRSDVPIVVVSGSEAPHAAAGARAAGATDFLPKDAAPDDLIAYPARIMASKL